MPVWDRMHTPLTPAEKRDRLRPATTEPRPCRSPEFLPLRALTKPAGCQADAA
jgi:hypothetical protein